MTVRPNVVAVKYENIEQNIYLIHYFYVYVIYTLISLDLLVVQRKDIFATAWVPFSGRLIFKPKWAGCVRKGIRHKTLTESNMRSMWSAVVTLNIEQPKERNMNLLDLLKMIRQNLGKVQRRAVNNSASHSIVINPSDHVNHLKRWFYRHQQGFDFVSIVVQLVYTTMTQVVDENKTEIGWDKNLQALRR